MRNEKLSPWGQIFVGLAFVAILFHSPAAAATDPCGLLTTQEVGAALHEEVRPPQKMQTGGCIWRGAETDNVTIEAPGTGRPGFENARSRMSPTVSLGGIGDAAFAFTSLAGFVEVGLVKGNNFLTVVVQTRSGKDTQAAARSLSAKIAGRLSN